MTFSIYSKEREIRTLGHLIGLYCRKHHHSSTGLCDECRSLWEYSAGRVEKCPYGERKGACSHCPIHCYANNRREQIRQVMRYAGPRILIRHPVEAFFHLLMMHRKGL